MLRNLWQNQQGIVLPLAVIMLAAFTLLGFSAVFMVENQSILGDRSIQTIDALHFAEAGIHAYLAHINKTPNRDWEKWEQPIPFENGYYELKEVEDDPEKNLEQVIQSTGWVKGAEDNKRTIQVSIGRRAFNQYSYFSGTDSYINSRGEKTKVVWANGEKCYGPYHTNDTLYIQKDHTPVFYGPVTYVNGAKIVNENKEEEITQNEAIIFPQGHRQIPAIEIPDTNYQLKERAMEQGHYYTGRTRILLKGSVYDAKYFHNGREKYEQNKPLPANGVIYVDGSVGTSKFSTNAGNVFVSGELSGNLTIGTANNIYICGYDPTEDIWYKIIDWKWSWSEWRYVPVYEFVATPTPRKGMQGIVYKNTEFKAKKENGITTGYEADTGKGDDLLGLVANNEVIILGYGWLNENRIDVAPENIFIHGAIFSIGGGFRYESYNLYQKGTITLRGSLIQEVRKPVGMTDGRGYKKDYAHDPRMLYATPPSFPEPLNTGWDIKEWVVDPGENG